MRGIKCGSQKFVVTIVHERWEVGFKEVTNQSKILKIKNQITNSIA